jgi:hypothetical protein
VALDSEQCRPAARPVEDGNGRRHPPRSRNQTDTHQRVFNTAAFAPVTAPRHLRQRAEERDQRPAQANRYRRGGFSPGVRNPSAVPRQLFNAVNQVSFNAPVTNISASNLGRIAAPVPTNRSGCAEADLVSSGPAQFADSRIENGRLRRNPRCAVSRRSV